MLGLPALHLGVFRSSAANAALGAMGSLRSWEFALSLATESRGQGVNPSGVVRTGTTEQSPPPLQAKSSDPSQSSAKRRIPARTEREFTSLQPWAFS